MDAAPTPRVVVGVSGRLGSLTALHRAAVEARRMDATLCAVLAWVPPGGELGHRESPTLDLLAECRRIAGEQLLNAFDCAFGPSGPGVPLQGLVVRGRPGPALVEAAGRSGDLLVVGAGARGRLHRMMRLSVARYCLTHATCPVLAVPPSPLQRELDAVQRRNSWRLHLDVRELVE
ncbi:MULTISPECIES: universal stress protein [unclassified Streptomyces]|uniref:Universal stress protein n=1 Tax=Streptomyces sp. NBC_00060 TaxID=2975636 RepID=A0AAU2H6V1_9ACTN